MRQLAVTAKNHSALDSTDDRWHHNWDKTLNAMTDLNNLLDEELGGNEDWGGQYATWLNRLGFDHQTDNGWWSLVAVDPDNIQAFIDAMRDDEKDGWFDQCQEAKLIIQMVAKSGSFKSRHKKVRDLVEEINEP